jgi:hypothetical protein
MNPSVTALELKKQLIARGFEVYRTIGNQVLLAERVRDNLIMDANVAAVAGEAFAARASYRAQQADFHGVAESELFAQAHLVATNTLDRGYREVDRTVVPIVDPSDRTRTLDTWYEVTVELTVGTIDELEAELRYLLSSPKIASDSRGVTG